MALSGDGVRRRRRRPGVLQADAELHATQVVEDRRRVEGLVAALDLDEVSDVGEQRAAELVGLGTTRSFEPHDLQVGRRPARARYFAAALS